MEVTEISLATLSDAKAISHLSATLIEKGLHTVRYSEEKVKDAILHPGKNVIVSKLGEKVIGLGIMSYHEDTANLDLLAVIPEFQGTGLASDLVSWLEDVALNAGIFKVSVQARETSERAIAFYKKSGYWVTAKVAEVYGSEAQIRLTKSVRL